MINADIQQFLERNDINLNEVSANVDCRLYSEREINEIVDRSAIRQKKQTTEVCIADILGYGEGQINIFSTMSDFFDSQGDGYHRRSVGLLDYTSDEIMWRLGDSFDREPIVVADVGDGKYVVSENGLHRYTVLRAHYLNELEKCKGDARKELRLREKYFIPVVVHELDQIKTYSKFLLTRYNPNIRSVRSEWNENYSFTGKTEIITQDGEKMILDDTQLIELLREKMSQQQDFSDLQRYFKYKDFTKFVQENLDGIVEILQIRENGGEEHD